MGHVVRLQDKGKPGQPGSLEGDFATLPSDLKQDPQAMNAFNAYAKIYGGTRREMEEALARGYDKVSGVCQMPGASRLDSPSSSSSTCTFHSSALLQQTMRVTCNGSCPQPDMSKIRQKSGLRSQLTPHLARF